MFGRGVRFNQVNESSIQYNKFTSFLMVTPEVRASSAFDCSRGRILTWHFLVLLEHETGDGLPASPQPSSVGKDFNQLLHSQD